MTRLWPDSEIIEVELKDGWPVRFNWQGHSHPVQQIRRRWQVDSDWWGEAGRASREYMTVITTDGLLCIIYFDLLEQTWRLAGVYD